MKQLLIVLILSLVPFISSCASDNESVELPIKENDKLFGIMLNENASVRLQPQLNSSRIASLNKGDTVQVVGRSASKSRIARVRDHWFQIRLASGVEGWTFGSNIKVLEEGDDFSIEDYKKEVAEEKINKILKQLKGKWWSVTRSGNFGNHSLQLYEDGTYKSIGSRRYEGEYSIDLEKNLLHFSNGASMGEDMTIVFRGQEILLEKETEKHHFRFKKIAAETDEARKKRLKEDYGIDEDSKEADKTK